MKQPKRPRSKSFYQRSIATCKKVKDSNDSFAGFDYTNPSSYSAQASGYWSQLSLTQFMAYFLHRPTPPIVPGGTAAPDFTQSAAHEVGAVVSLSQAEDNRHKRESFFSILQNIVRSKLMDFSLQSTLEFLQSETVCSIENPIVSALASNELAEKTGDSHCFFATELANVTQQISTSQKPVYVRALDFDLTTGKTSIPQDEMMILRSLTDDMGFRDENPYSEFLTHAIGLGLEFYATDLMNGHDNEAVIIDVFVTANTKPNIKIRMDLFAAVLNDLVLLMTDNEHISMTFQQEQIHLDAMLLSDLARSIHKRSKFDVIFSQNQNLVPHHYDIAAEPFNQAYVKNFSGVSPNIISGFNDQYQANYAGRLRAQRSYLQAKDLPAIKITETDYYRDLSDRYQQQTKSSSRHGEALLVGFGNITVPQDSRCHLSKPKILEAIAKLPIEGILSYDDGSDITKWMKEKPGNTANTPSLFSLTLNNNVTLVHHQLSRNPVGLIAQKIFPRSEALSAVKDSQKRIFNPKHQVSLETLIARKQVNTSGHKSSCAF